MTLLLILLGVVFSWLVKQALGALVGQQVRGSIPEYTAGRVRSAVQKLPSDLKEAYEAEWLAELATLDAKPITAIRYVNGLSRAAREIAQRVGGQSPESQLALVAARGRDIASSAALLFLFSPLLSAIGLAALLIHKRRPILARSAELGKDGKPFQRFRFVTLKRSPDGEFVMTPLGRFLCRFSLQELPILINVLRGDLSLVGPPTRRLAANTDGQVVLKVRPGIFSWQVLAARGLVGLSLDEAQGRDEHRTLKGDFILILHSIKAVARGEI